MKCPICDNELKPISTKLWCIESLRHDRSIEHAYTQHMETHEEYYRYSSNNWQWAICLEVRDGQMTIFKPNFHAPDAIKVDLKEVDFDPKNPEPLFERYALIKTFA